MLVVIHSVDLFPNVGEGVDQVSGEKADVNGGRPQQHPLINDLGATVPDTRITTKDEYEVIWTGSATFKTSKL